MTKQPDDKRQAILAAALELFAERGFHGAPTAQIAALAGVGVGTIYRHFKDKDELIQELHRELRERCHARIYEDYAGQQPVRERFRFVFHRLLRLFTETPREFRFMEQFYYSPYATSGEAQGAGEDEILHQLLAEGRRRGELKEAPVVVLQALAFGPLMALVKEQINGRLRIDEALIELATAASWDAIRR